MPGGLSRAPWQPARDPMISDLSADRLLSHRYEVSGALEPAPKIGVGSQGHLPPNAGSIRREARAVPVAPHLGAH